MDFVVSFDQILDLNLCWEVQTPAQCIVGEITFEFVRILIFSEVEISCNFTTYIFVLKVNCGYHMP